MRAAEGHNILRHAFASWKRSMEAEKVSGLKQLVRRHSLIMEYMKIHNLRPWGVRFPEVSKLTSKRQF